MSTIEKNIYTIQDKLTKLKPKSRAFLKYNCRLLKKIEQYKRFIETRTREESLSRLKEIILFTSILPMK